MIYTLYEVDQCNITTMEGRTFKIDVWYIDTIATWLPTGRLIYNKQEKTLAYEASGQKVKVVR
jgi:hypothetical protein